MKKILSIAWKDTKIRFTGFSEWLFFLILPIVFTLILGGSTGANPDNRIRLLVVDLAQTPLSADFLAALEKSEAVRPILTDLADAETQFSQRNVSVVLVIPPEFNLENLEKGAIELELRQQPNNLNGLVAQQSVMAVARRVSSTVDIAAASLRTAEEVRGSPFSDEERRSYFESSLKQAQTLLAEAPNRMITTRGATPDQIEYDPRANSSAGQLITWVFIPLFGLSEMFAIERQKGTLRRILVTPTRKGTYLFGTIFGQVITALFQMALLIGFGILVMKLNWGQNLPALLVMMLASAMTAAAFGTMLGTFVRTGSQANGLSIMLGMVMALLGGCWYPIELFPQAVQNAVKVLPTTWAMEGLLDLVLRGKGLIDILPEAGVLVGFAAVFFVIGIWRFRYE